MATLNDKGKDKKMTMPKANIQEINNSLLTDEYKAIMSIVVKKSGEIRASKPKVKNDNHITGKAAYVWRMVCFQVSPKPQHQCMPVTANFDLPAFDENGNWKSVISREMEKNLDILVKMIVDSIPKSQWYGINRWSRAFGF